MSASRRLSALALLGAALPGCSASPTTPTDAAPAPTWQVMARRTDGALLSSWGSNENDLFAVGGPVGNGGEEPLVLHFDGKNWTKLPVSGGDTFWWTQGTATDDVWMVGEHGRILHWNGTALTESPAQTAATLFGVWAASKTEAWAVGGSPGLGTSADNDVVFHWDGTSWTRVKLPGTPLGRTLFKVWGVGPGNVYVVGEAGTIWHLKAGTWSIESTAGLAHGTLLSVSGCSATEVYVAGGHDLLRWDGSAWAPIAVPLVNELNGVACARGGQAFVVGFGGTKGRVTGGVWVDETTDDPADDLHGVWADAAGAIWASGGDFVTPATPGATREGVVARRAPVGANQ